MRKIKFRIWDDDRDRENKFLYFDLGTDRGRADLFHCKLALMGGELNQFTGLLDRNGVEIFSGDIVKCIYPGEHIVKVKWDTYNPCFCLERYDREFTSDIEYDFIKCGMQKLEVIGNVYQDSHLLDKPKKIQN